MSSCANISMSRAHQMKFACVAHCQHFGLHAEIDTMRQFWVQVIAQLLGEKQLPWQERDELGLQRLEALGVFKGAILQMLNLDPSLRPSMERFYNATNRVFSSRATIQI